MLVFVLLNSKITKTKQLLLFGFVLCFISRILATKFLFLLLEKFVMQCINSVLNDHKDVIGAVKWNSYLCRTHVVMLWYYWLTDFLFSFWRAYCKTLCCKILLWGEWRHIDILASPIMRCWLIWNILWKFYVQLNMLSDPYKCHMDLKHARSCLYNNKIWSLEL